jgi:hypothetical protein
VNQWIHLAASYDSAYLKLYVNGTVAHATAFSSALGNSLCDWGIGGWTSACGFSGQYVPSGSQIDEVSLYSRALLDGEINAIYQAGVAGKCKGPPPCAPCPPGAVASWPGEGDASDMFNHYPGTLQNGVSFDQGLVARAFSFNPTNLQAVELPSISGLLTSPFSLEAWIKPVAPVSGSPAQAFIFGQSYSAQLVVRNGQQGVRVAFDIASNRWTFQELLGSYDLPLGQWSHVVGVYAGSVMSLYVNGAPDQQATVTLTPFDSGCPWHLGGVFDPSAGDCTYTGQFFNGLIDEAAVYGQAISAADVQALYNAGGAGKCGSLGNWLLHYFGPDCWNQPYATAPADADEDGNINLQEYYWGTDPNKIAFRASFPNDHVNADTVNATVVVQRGIPNQMAVLVDSTNFTTANWTAYSPTVPVPLGSTDGRHDVWIGLKGWAADSVQTWRGFRLTRDTTAPTNYITTPAPGTDTLSRPVLQLQGYSLEPLAAVRYDLANAAGSVTGLEGYVTRQWFDTNLLAFTTNWFECLDIQLTNGANTITLYLTDQAGNVSTRVCNYTLDYAGVTQPPALTLYWPSDGARLSGTSFTLRGLLDDPTATVSAQITDANGVTSQADGLVERSGLLWVENLPLGPGTNTLTLAMTNAAGLSSSTSLKVIQSDVVLTIGDLSTTDFNQPFIYVGGTISADGYTVWVNGIQATPFGGGAWGAIDVPVNEGGTAVIQVRAIPNTDHDGHGTGGSGGTVSTMADPGNPSSAGARDTEASPDKAPVVVQIHYDKMVANTFCKPDSDYQEAVHERIWWDLGQSGGWLIDTCRGTAITEISGYQDKFWDASGEGTWFHGGDEGPGVCGATVYTNSDPYTAPTALPAEFCESSAPRDLSDGPQLIGHETCDRTAHSRYELRTNGKAHSTRQNLFVLTAGATGIGNDYWPETDSQEPWDYDIPSTSIVLGGFGPEGSDGRIYKVLPDNTTHDITPTVSGNPYYVFDQPNATKHGLLLWANESMLDEKRVADDAIFCVGQSISFDGIWRPTTPYNGDPPGVSSSTYDWVTSSKYVNHQSAPNSAGCITYDVDPDALKQCIPFVWYVNGGDKNVRLNLTLHFNNGQSAKISEQGKFNVFRPKKTDFYTVGTTRIVLDTNDLSEIWLGIADKDSTAGEMEWTAEVSGDYTRFPGTVTYVQLISRTLTYDSTLLPYYPNHSGSTIGEPYLDGSYPYHCVTLEDQSAFQITQTLSDDPGIEDSFYSFAEVTDTFNDYICYTPSGGIPITIGRVDWAWHGKAQTSGGMWSLTISNLTNATFHDDDSFPQWSQVYKNSPQYR